jgi:hypothetical protein
LYPSHSKAPFLFARSKEPDELAAAIAAKSIEHMRRNPALSARDLAILIQSDLNEYSRHYYAMERALNTACQVALINGASAEEMKAIRAPLDELNEPAS